MLIAVITLGATMLGATTIAGLLMLYQIRQATDFANSAKSIFAADAGSQWALYNYFQLAGQPESARPTFSNGATILVNCYDASSTITLCTATSSANAIAKGSAGDTKRALLATFSAATGALP